MNFTRRVYIKVFLPHTYTPGLHFTRRVLGFGSWLSFHQLAWTHYTTPQDSKCLVSHVFTCLPNYCYCYCYCYCYYVLSLLDAIWLWYRKEDFSTYYALKEMLFSRYVKVYLLPDKTKTSKKKTTHRRKTLNPQWNETIKVKP